MLKNNDDDELWYAFAYGHAIDKQQVAEADNLLNCYMADILERSCCSP